MISKYLILAISFMLSVVSAETSDDCVLTLENQKMVFTSAVNGNEPCVEFEKIKSLTITRRDFHLVFSKFTGMKNLKCLKVENTSDASIVLPFMDKVIIVDFYGGYTLGSLCAEAKPEDNEILVMLDEDTKNVVSSKTNIVVLRLYNERRNMPMSKTSDRNSNFTVRDCKRRFDICKRREFIQVDNITNKSPKRLLKDVEDEMPENNAYELCVIGDSDVEKYALPLRDSSDTEAEKPFWPYRILYIQEIKDEIPMKTLITKIKENGIVALDNELYLVANNTVILEGNTSFIFHMYDLVPLSSINVYDDFYTGLPTGSAYYIVADKKLKCDTENRYCEIKKEDLIAMNDFMERINSKGTLNIKSDVYLVQKEMQVLSTQLIKSYESDCFVSEKVITPNRNISQESTFHKCLNFRFVGDEAVEFIKVGEQELVKTSKSKFVDIFILTNMVAGKNITVDEIYGILNSTSSMEFHKQIYMTNPLCPIFTGNWAGLTRECLLQIELIKDIVQRLYEEIENITNGNIKMLAFSTAEEPEILSGNYVDTSLYELYEVDPNTIRKNVNNEQENIYYIDPKCNGKLPFIPPHCIMKAKQFLDYTTVFNAILGKSSANAYTISKLLCYFFVIYFAFRSLV